MILPIEWVWSSFLIETERKTEQESIVGQIKNCDFYMNIYRDNKATMNNFHVAVWVTLFSNKCKTAALRFVMDWNQ